MNKLPWQNLKDQRTERHKLMTHWGQELSTTVKDFKSGTKTLNEVQTAQFAYRHARATYYSAHDLYVWHRAHRRDLVELIRADLEEYATSLKTEALTTCLDCKGKGTYQPFTGPVENCGTCHGKGEV